MALRLKVLEMLPFGGKALIHFMHVWTIMTSIRSGIDLKGSKCLIA